MLEADIQIFSWEWWLSWEWPGVIGISNRYREVGASTKKSPILGSGKYWNKAENQCSKNDNITSTSNAVTMTKDSRGKTTILKYFSVHGSISALWPALNCSFHNNKKRGRWSKTCITGVSTGIIYFGNYFVKASSTEKACRKTFYEFFCLLQRVGIMSK